MAAWEILNIEEVNGVQFNGDLFWQVIWDEGVCKTDINTSEMTKKITQDMVVAPYENTYKRNLLAEKSLIDTLTDNRFSSVEEFVGFLNNHDDTYLSKMYINDNNK